MTRFWIVRHKQKLFGNLGKSLKRYGTDPAPSFSASCYWNGNVMAGAPAPVLGLEMTYTIGAICQSVGQAILKT